MSKYWQWYSKWSPSIIGLFTSIAFTYLLIVGLVTNSLTSFVFYLLLTFFGGPIYLLVISNMIADIKSSRTAKRIVGFVPPFVIMGGSAILIILHTDVDIAYTLVLIAIGWLQLGWRLMTKETFVKAA